MYDYFIIISIDNMNMHVAIQGSATRDIKGFARMHAHAVLLGTTVMSHL